MPELDLVVGSSGSGFTWLFSLVSYRAGTGLGREEGGFVPTLESLCVSPALRTEFHGLCQCQTCEV